MLFLLKRIASHVSVAFLLVYACAHTSEQATILPANLSLQTLQAETERIVNDSLMRHGALAFSLQSVKTGKPLFAYNAGKSVVIASNLKLVTTATALAILGEEYTFKTTLQHDGTLTNGVLNGNLYIRGGGDPTLGSDRYENGLNLSPLLESWTEAIQRYGIRQINGAIIGDASLFEDNATPGGWIWGDLGNYYGAAAYGLNIHENLYRLYFKPGAKTDAPTRILRTEPAVPELNFVNLVKTGKPGSGDQAYIYGAPYTGLRYVEGTIPAGVNEFAIRGSVPDPAKLCAGLLRDRLTVAGVKVSEPATTTRLLRLQGKRLDTKWKDIHTHNSPLLRDIVAETNLQSINLYAEALLKTLGDTLAGKPTTEGGAEAVVDFWQKQGIRANGFFMRDGSGLSRTNAIAAETVTDILVYCANKPFFKGLYASLPVAGISGTMKNMGKGTAMARNVRAKTGSLERVMAYSGYFRNKSGELVAFALVANDYAGSNSVMRKKLERLMVLMAGS